MSSASSALLEKLKCEISLHEFVRQAWPQVEGKTPFVDGWYIKALCDHLEATITGDIPKLIINVPPRTGKTSIISIMFPAWVFIHHPNLKFLFSSYAQKISLEHSRLCKSLILSPWYQSRWGKTVRLSKDQSAKGHFATTQFGHRIATSVSAGGTALGGNILVMDDPNDASHGESQVTRESVNDWVSRVWPSRLNPGVIAAEILVQQRIHEMDVSGYVMSRDLSDEWVRLILPMEFEVARKARTIILPSTGGKVWEDPRTQEGELLCPSYLDEKAIKQKKIALGKYNYAGQYQQRPSPAQGGMIDRGWFRVWRKEALPIIKYMVQSWDTALTDKTSSDYSACTTWGTFTDENKVTNLLLMYAWKGKVTYPELLKRALRMQRNCSDIGDEELKADIRYQPDLALVESKAAGHPLISDFLTKGISVRGFDPGRYGDKTNRVSLVSSLIENGRVWVLGDSDGKLTKDHEMVVENCALFPNAESDDLVDTVTQVILFLSKEKGMLTHSFDLEFNREIYPKEQMPGYVPPKLIAGNVHGGNK